MNKEAIKSALAAMQNGVLLEKSKDLLSTLGYRSELTHELPGTVHDFFEEFPPLNPNTKTEQEFRKHAESAQIIFQFTKDEIEDDPQQMTLLESNSFDKGNIKSFLFCAVELKDNNYSRTKYAQFTREINKRLFAPTVILFRAGDRLTVAFADRRPDKTDGDRDVLGQVTLIKDIRLNDPHRAHLDILSELSLEECAAWMNDKKKPKNFDGLLAAWLAKLDTEELNKKFYRRLFAWYEWAVKEATFPTDENRVIKPEEHVIHLITRLLFIWFIKEKGLVANDLFVKDKIQTLLNEDDFDNGDSYYRAVLQNLFFATLNTEIDKREFSKENYDTNRDFSCYRYKTQMHKPKKLLKLFNKTPFINGGLFDCLDTWEATGKNSYRIDCFSDKQYHKLSIPNRLFFQEKTGLLSIFEDYKFTVEENTPIEQEVALDPELLGNVFEHFLAEINQDTRKNAASARKKTGSYYTPRAIVDYMVDEALVATFSKMCHPTDGNINRWEKRLRYLLDFSNNYDDPKKILDGNETDAVIRTISTLKILDPAVGSGAFPMGMLHKLTLVLRKLDPNNIRWEKLQRNLAGERARDSFASKDDQERPEELIKIDNTFKRYRDSDFGRKLYLIQNSIFGLDILTIACQIAKLRFFISLAIEQQPNDNPDENFGIKPLPNLETRFVAANTLIGLDITETRQLLQDDIVQQLLKEIEVIREKFFLANDRGLKYQLVKDEKKYRKQLEKELEQQRTEWIETQQREIERKIALLRNSEQCKQMREKEHKTFEARKKQFDAHFENARKIAHWKPYDQNAIADWFDPEWMFGVTDGFDIVIGNPPYRQVRKNVHSSTQFPFSEGKDKGKQNLYKLFVEQSYNLCKFEGIATLIVQSSLMCDLSSSYTRQLLLECTQLKHIIEFPKQAKSKEAQVFNSVTQGTCIYQFTKIPPDNQPIQISVGNDILSIRNLNFSTISKNTIIALYPELYCFPHIRKGSVSILEKIASNPKIKPLADYATDIVQGDLNLTTHASRFSNSPTSVLLLRGKHVSRFIVKYNKSVEYCEEDFLTDKIDENQNKVFLISQEVTGTVDPRRLHFALTYKPSFNFLWGHTVNKTLLKNQNNSRVFLALLNSKFMDWYFRITSTNNHVQGYELKQLPIPPMSDTNLKRLDNLAKRVMEAKTNNLDADTTELEKEIDKLVYSLYDLDDEIAIVEGSV